MKDADSKVVFITGGGSGLGRVMVGQFWQAGYRVFFTYRTKRKSIGEMVEESHGRVFAFQADASEYQSAAASVDKAVEVFGRIDILINNAASAKVGAIVSSTPEDFDFTIHNALYPVYHYIRAVAPHMIGREGGKIINIGSVNGLHGREGSAAYAAAKAGVVGLTKTAAKELGQYGISCNVVAPGYIATDGQKNTSELVKKLVLSECYIKKLSEPEEVSNLVEFLAGDKSDNITGQVFQIDCGQYI